MLGAMKKHLEDAIGEIREAGLYKAERVLAGPQGAWVKLSGGRAGRRVLNLCSNNYLGLSGHPEMLAAAKAGLEEWGNGLSSVRFICGTQELHKKLEAAVSEFLGIDDAVLYSSCFDANGGLFETLLTADDAVISDELNHASIIDGIRLCKARRFRFKSSDMADLEAKLTEADAAGARFKMIATDGVFSMDGTIADLAGICDLADKYEALVMVDDSHATGVIGATGRGSPEHRSVAGRVDIITGTFGKALGGASGGFTAARREIVEMLRQRSRPYLFSNTVAPGVAAASLKAVEMLAASSELVTKLARNTGRLRAAMTDSGFKLPPGEHPIIPVMLGEARLAGEMAEKLLAEDIYVIGFSYPVVPKGAARVRVQVSAALSDEDIDLAAGKFAKVGAELGVI